METEKPTLLEIYKTYVQTAENISEKRLKVNSFYLTFCSTLITILLALTKLTIVSDFIIFIDLLGVILCIIWSVNIKSYKLLNSAKYEVIKNLEKRLSLPVSCFSEEWEILKDKKYRRLSDMERYIPYGFIGIFLLHFFFYLCNIPIRT